MAEDCPEVCQNKIKNNKDDITGHKEDIRTLFDQDKDLEKSKVSMKYFYLLCLIVIGAYGYATSVASNHSIFATKSEVEKEDRQLSVQIAEVKDNIEKVNDKVEDMRIEIKSDMQRMEDKILEAIEKK